MSAAAIPYSTVRRDATSRLLRAWLATGVVDGLFAVVLNVYILRTATAQRLFQGIASTILGKAAMAGGATTAAIGLAMHFGVALGWSALFLLLVTRSARIRAVLDSPYGALKVAAVYGPVIWIVMSLVVIPLLVHRAPAINTFWWIELVGHIPFVGLPIAAFIGSGSR
jgi:hypothetical protein